MHAGVPSAMVQCDNLGHWVFGYPFLLLNAPVRQNKTAPLLWYISCSSSWVKQKTTLLPLSRNQQNQMPRGHYHWNRNCWTLYKTWNKRKKQTLIHDLNTQQWSMLTPSNGNSFRVTGLLCGEFTGHRWFPNTKASDAELWYFLWCAPQPTVEQTMETPVIWDAIALIMTSL